MGSLYLKTSETIYTLFNGLQLLQKTSTKVRISGYGLKIFPKKCTFKIEKEKGVGTLNDKGTLKIFLKAILTLFNSSGKAVRRPDLLFSSIIKKIIFVKSIVLLLKL